MPDFSQSVPQPSYPQQPSSGFPPPPQGYPQAPAPGQRQTPTADPAQPPVPVPFVTQPPQAQATPAAARPSFASTRKGKTILIASVAGLLVVIVVIVLIIALVVLPSHSTTSGSANLTYHQNASSYTLTWTASDLTVSTQPAPGGTTYVYWSTHVDWRVTNAAPDGPVTGQRVTFLPIYDTSLCTLFTTICSSDSLALIFPAGTHTDDGVSPEGSKTLYRLKYIDGGQVETSWMNLDEGESYEASGDGEGLYTCPNDQVDDLIDYLTHLAGWVVDGNYYSSLSWDDSSVVGCLVDLGDECYNVIIGITGSLAFKK